jgi:predicted dehydrogenase
MWNNFQVGIIGSGGQYQRISKILKRKKIGYYLYKPNNKNYFNKNDYEKLKTCNVIFILSSNNSHFNYIKNLYRNRYIFCEKPPVNKKEELKKLYQINYKKIYFNFNFRFSKIAEMLSLRKKFKLGNLLYGNIILGHGLALKKVYGKNWRSNIKYNKKGVFELVSVHWLDLINYFYKLKKVQNIRLENFSKIGNSYDNSYCTIVLKNKAEIDVFSSYTSPLIKKINFVFKNGTITQDENIIEIRGPANNFDKNNFFVKPKIIKKYILSEKRDYQLSLEKSVNFFLETAKKKLSFKKKDFDCSITSNEMILK